MQYIDNFVLRNNLCQLVAVMRQSYYKLCVLRMNSHHHRDRKNVSVPCSDDAETTKSSSDKENLRLAQPQQSLLSTHRVPRQRHQTRNPNYYVKGLWSEKEQNQFLKGLMMYGWGQWKEIGTIITTRYVIF